MKRLFLIPFLMLPLILINGIATGDEENLYFIALKELAEDGDAHAQYEVAIHYLNSCEDPKNTEEGLKWLFKSVEQGYPKAQQDLGLMYYDSKIVSQNYNKALNLFQKAADQDNPEAQFSLGTMYVNGYGTPANYDKALIWYEKAAENGNIKAQFNLGNMHAMGKGVPVNNINAYMWWNVASIQGDENAKHNLSVLSNKMTEDQIVQAKEKALLKNNQINDKLDELFNIQCAEIEIKLEKIRSEGKGITPEEANRIIDQLRENSTPEIQTFIDNFLNEIEKRQDL